MHWLWIALTIALIVLELASTQAFFVWFSLGSLVTAIISAFTPLAFYWEILIFLALSLALLFSLRWLIVKKIKKHREKNQDK